MNCNDLVVLVDGGTLDRLRKIDRDAADAHARTCSRCAALWASHTRLAGLVIPRMPADLPLRCRTYWLSSPRTGVTRMISRRVTLIGSVIAMAAAAGVISLVVRDPVDLSRTQSGALAFEELAPANSIGSESSVLPSVADGQGVLPTADGVGTREAGPDALPLLPAPSFPSYEAELDRAFLRALDRHPELTNGPALDGAFAVVVFMQPDGSVIHSEARHFIRETQREINEEMQRLMPSYSVVIASSSTRKTEALPGGRALRADVGLRVALVPYDYDMGRSSVRVNQLLANRVQDLMLPVTGTEFNHLTVLLREDGSIQREKVERISLQDRLLLQRRNARDSQKIAEQFAATLDVTSDQIGLMGFTAPEDGALAVANESGASRAQDERRTALVSYAWQRRSSETRAAWGQTGSARPQASNRPNIALLIVERLMPDAFAKLDPALGRPAVVLTYRGEVLRTGRLKPRAGQGIGQLLQEQIAPGVETRSFADIALTSKTGQTANVLFAWEGPKPVAPPDAPLPIRREFEIVFRESPALTDAHAAMEQEPRDAQWAGHMEESFRRAFAANVELSKYGVPIAECRTTRCEIQMVAYRAPFLAREQWGELLGRGLMDQPAPNPGSSPSGTPGNFAFDFKVIDETTVLVFHVAFVRPSTRP